MPVTDLKFDEMQVSTKLAEEYLTRKKEFRPIGYMGSGEFECDQFGNKIYFCNKEEISKSITFYRSGTDIDTDSILKLVTKIEENTELFCQLEYLLRKIPLNETKNIDLKLIKQALLHQSTAEYVELNERTNADHVKLRYDTPLFYLGDLFFFSKTWWLICTKETVAVCTLFIDLCLEVGLNVSRVHLAIVKSSNDYPTISFQDNLKNPEWGGGCVGVVTDKSDVDSAVDTFLYATTRYPWKVRRVLVQEAAMERFKRAIEWKTNLAGAARAVDERLERFCTATYCFEDKIFLHEFVGDETVAASANAIVIEPFRTVKELNALLAALAPFAVTLWASDVAESREIAHCLNTNIIWINCYEQFDWQPDSSEALYSAAYRGCPDYKHEDAVEMVRKEWLKLTPQYRISKIQEALQEYKRTVTGENTELINFSLRVPRDTTISFDKHECVTIKRPHLAHLSIDDVFSVHVFDFIIGGGSIIMSGCASEQLLMAEVLQKFGVPMFYTSNLNKHDHRRRPSYKTKVIWSSMGTTFAN